MESCINGVPAVAVSLGPDVKSGTGAPTVLAHAGAIAAEIIQNVLARGLPEQTMLNVNVPWSSADVFRGIEITRLGRRVYRDMLVRRDDPWGRPYYWIGGEVPSGIPDDGTDIGAIENGIVSVTPLGIDLTRHDFLAVLKEWRFSRTHEATEAQP
jgi:5'-nucleotidase